MFVACPCPWACTNSRHVEKSNIDLGTKVKMTGIGSVFAKFQLPAICPLRPRT